MILAGPVDLEGVTEIMRDHSIYLRVSGVYIHEITQGLTPYLCVTRKVPAWSQV
jgi:hypothetical protein